MYHDFFGFTQVPFSIAPDPDFLFLGPRHREGLAHLRNGLTGSGGFLLLTGEVGTGKTTLSRAILAELGGGLDVAFVLNPMLSERELLATICDQFGIPGRHEKASLKRLTDHLSRFLQEAGEQGRNPVVLIDEAQHLLPSVLEQLRLLTNLETDSRKLLSVVLIGQPELQELLQRRELRQVAQRIVARYHLLPLTLVEMKEYIQHRLQRVGGREDIFSARALKNVWQFSQGTPRLINLVCDRSLQIAARDEVQQVSAKHVTEAVASLSFAPAVRNREATGKGFLRAKSLVVAAILVFGIGALGWGAARYLPEIAASGGSSTTANSRAGGNVDNSPSNIGVGMPILPAIEALAEQWDVASFAVGAEPCQQLLDVDLACLRSQFSVPELIQFDVPLIIEGKQSPSRYYLLVGYGNAGDDQERNNQENNSKPWAVWDGTDIHWLADAEFNQLYSGQALILWQVPNSEELPEVITNGLAARVPFTLQNRSLQRQLQWLRQSQAARIDAMSIAANASSASTNSASNEENAVDSGADSSLTPIELALLSSAHYQQRPRLLDAVEPMGGLTQTNSEQITYLGAADSLSDLTIPYQSLAIPAQFLAATDSPSNESGNVANEEGERLATRQVDMSADEELANVSPRIRALFDQAVDEVGVNTTAAEPAPEQIQALRSVNDLTAAERRSLPRFEYNSHMYSGRTQERWIRLNNRMLREGDRLGELRVIQIEAAHTIFGFREILFRVEALEDLTD